MTKDEALKLALEFLERPAWRHEYALANINQASTAIKEALAQPEQTNIERHEANVKKFLGAPQPEQEPVAMVKSVATVVSESGNQEVTMSWWHEPALPVGTKLYTTPPQRKPLTNEQREEIAKGWRGRNWTVGHIIDAIEAAHGIKE